MSILRGVGSVSGGGWPQEPSAREPSPARPKFGAVPLPGVPPRSLFLALDLGGRADAARVARGDVEDALAGAEGDVLLEAGRPIGSGVQAVERVGQGLGENLRGDGGVRRRAVQLGGDATRAV